MVDDRIGLIPGESSLFELPFESYLEKRIEKAKEAGFLKWFPQPESLEFMKVLWSKQYWFAKTESLK